MRLALLDGILDGGQSGDDSLKHAKPMRCQLAIRYISCQLRLTAGLVISLVFLSWGTLKSTRMRTFSPLRETSVMVSLLERDILGDQGFGIS